MTDKAKLYQFLELAKGSMVTVNIQSSITNVINTYESFEYGVSSYGSLGIGGRDEENYSTSINISNVADIVIDEVIAILSCTNENIIIIIE